MSKLASYLEQTQLTQSDFAAAVGVKQSTISRLKNGRFAPSLELAAKIEKLTKGAVPAAALLPTQREGDAA